MAVPALVAAGIKYGPAAYGLIKGLLGGKSPQQKAQEAAMKRLQNIAEKGLDPSILNRALQILNARQRGEESGLLSRLSAGGIDPSSGLAQEALGAGRRSLGMRTGEASALFNERSLDAQERANAQLAGMNVVQDDSTGDLLGALLTNLSQEKFMQPKAPSIEDDLMRIRSPRSLTTTPRGGYTARSPQLIPRRY